MLQRIRGNTRIINYWALYDWANSAYLLVVTSTIFPIYYIASTSNGDDHMVRFFGIEMVNSVLYSYALAITYLVVMAISPLLSSIADFTGTKKGFMRFFCYLGSFSCCLLFAFNGNNIELGIILFVLAGIGYSGSLVFYNAYLPLIARRDQQDAVSARGYALGYFGSVILLVFCLVMVMFPQWFGISNPSLPPRIAFLLTGLWWFGFAEVTFRVLPSNIFGKKRVGNIVLNGYRQLGEVWREFLHIPRLKWFLISMLFFMMGLQTVMFCAQLFGTKELQMKDDQLIITILILQIIAIPGAYLFAWLSGKTSNVITLLIASAIWVGICIGAYFIESAGQFYVVAFFVGMVMGGMQSLSRSTYSKFLPETSNHASYFSFYDVVEKTTIVLGTFSFGLIEDLTGSMRNSVVTLITFFIIGGILLLVTRKYEKNYVEQKQ